MSQTAIRIFGSFFALFCLGWLLIVYIREGVSASLLLGCMTGIILGVIGCFDLSATSRKSKLSTSSSNRNWPIIALSIFVGVAIPGIARILGMPYSIAIFIICTLGTIGVVVFTYIGWFTQPAHDNTLSSADFLRNNSSDVEELEWRRAKERLQREQTEWNEQQRRQ